MYRKIKFIIGILMLPLCIAVTRATLDVLYVARGSGSFWSAETVSLLVGFGVWLLCWKFLPLPHYIYTLGHELTHALWTMLFGGRASKMRVTARSGGSVKVTKSNVMVILAPYFFPFYTILLVVLRLVTGLFWDMTPYAALWLFFIGLTWSFHFTFTLHSFKADQSDIRRYGRLFSYVLIYILNILGIGLWIVCATSATAGDWVRFVALRTANVYTGIWNLMF